MFAFYFQIQGKVIIIYYPVTVFYVLKLKNKVKTGKYLSMKVMILKNVDLIAFFTFR